MATRTVPQKSAAELVRGFYEAHTLVVTIEQNLADMACESKFYQMEHEHLLRGAEQQLRQRELELKYPQFA